MANILQKFKDLFLLLLSLTYISYIIYIRLFLIRNPRTIYIELSELEIIITVIIIVVLVFRIYILLKKLEIIKEKEKKHKIILWILEKVHAIVGKINNILLKFYRLFVLNFLTVHNFLRSLARFLNKHKSYNFALAIILIFDVLPKLIVLICFLIDIFIFKQFYCFYKVLFLLLLPLIYTVLEACLQQFYLDHDDFFKDYVKKTYNFHPCGPKYAYLGEYFVVPAYELAEGYNLPYFIKDVADFFENYYFPINTIKTTLPSYAAVKIYFKIYWILLIILILHLLGWLTILFFGI